MPDKGILNRIFHKNKKINAQRVVISDAQKRSKDDAAKENNGMFEAIDFSDLYEETGLEETPAADYMPQCAGQSEKKTDKAKPKEKQRRSETVAAGVNGYRSGRPKKKKAGLLGALNFLPSIAKKEPKTSNSSALEFAGNTKRLGRKGRKNRRILIYSGSGLLVAAVLLFVILVPGGAAAPADASRTTGGAATATKGNSYVASQNTNAVPLPSAKQSGANESAALSVPPTVTPQVSTTPEPTLIETTKPDVTPPPINLDKEVETFKVEADRYYNEMGYSSNYYKYTDEEYYILAQVIYMEARGEEPKGKLAVGNVIMNRVLCRGAFPNNIKAVVTSPHQFAYSSSAKPNIASKIAAKQVLDYQVWVVPQDVYYFRAVYKFKHLEGQSWNGHKYYQKIDGHYFYRASHSGRMRGGGIPPSMYDRTFQWPTMGCKPEERVYRLQWMLNKLGYDVKADRYFGEGTKEAIKEFQKKKGLKVDGVAGPVTVKALIKEFGLKEYYIKFCT